MTASNIQRRNDFLHYLIAQRAILNEIILDDYQSLKIKDGFSSSFMTTLKLKLYSLMRTFKWFMRDAILVRFIKQKIILVGTGGHAKVVIDIIRKEGKYNIVGCTSSDVSISKFEGIRVFGSDEMFPVIFSKGVVKAFVAIGDNKTRSIVFNKAKKIGFEIVTIIHSDAIIGHGCFIGAGTCVMVGSIINPSTTVGQGCIINTNSNIDHDCIVEDYVHIAPGCSIAGNVHIGRGAFVGTGVNIIPQVVVGEKCTIGAGSVVDKNIPGGSMAYGVPVKVKK